MKKANTWIPFPPLLRAIALRRGAGDDKMG